MSLTERCEACLNLRLSSQVKTLGKERVCVVCLPSRTGILKIEESGEERCEECMLMTLSKFVIDVTKHGRVRRLCPKCAQPQPEWFAATIYHSEPQAIKAIRKNLQKEGLDRFVKKIVVARSEQTRTTKSQWGVYTAANHKLGNVSAVDYDEAMHKAKSTFEPKSQKGVFKPDHFDPDLVLKDISKIIEWEGPKGQKKRVTKWACYARNGELLGKIVDTDRKKAEETAKKLYSPKEKKDPTQIVMGEVAEVKLEKVGGKTITQNRKAISGYLLICCYNNSDVFQCIKDSPGVIQLLPYVRQDLIMKKIKKKGEEESEWKPVKIDAAESDVETGKVSHRMSKEENNWHASNWNEPPASIPSEEIEKVVEIRKPQPATIFNVGDEVRINGGMFNNQDGVVRSVDDKVHVELEVLRRQIIIAFAPHSLLK